MSLDSDDEQAEARNELDVSFDEDDGARVALLASVSCVFAYSFCCTDDVRSSQSQTADGAYNVE
jgi:hypothetical protein